MKIKHTHTSNMHDEENRAVQYVFRNMDVSIRREVEHGIRVVSEDVIYHAHGSLNPNEEFVFALEFGS